MNNKKSRVAQAMEKAKAPRSGDYLHGVEHFFLEDGDRPIEVMAASVFGICGVSEDADEATFPLNKPVLVNSEKFIAKAGTGPLRDCLEDIYRQGGALGVVVRSDGEDVVGGVGPDEDGNYIGLQALLTAETVTGVRPTLLGLAVGKQDFVTHVPALGVIADKLHAIPIVSVMEGGPEAAVNIADGLDGFLVVQGTCWFGNEPDDVQGDVVIPGAPIYRDPVGTVIGHILRVDNTEGYWNSPSSRKILGITGMKNPVDHAIGSKTSTANYLNSKQVCVIVQQKGGHILFGDVLTGAQQMMIQHQRVRYIVGLSIQEAHQSALDRNVTANYVESVKGKVNGLLRRLVLREVISGGECWVDNELNQSLINTNQVVWDYDLGLWASARRITFRQHINSAYNEAIFG